MCRVRFQDTSITVLEITQRHTDTNQLEEFFREFEIALL